MPSHTRRPGLLTLFFAIVILPLSGIGFGMKFIEFIHVFKGDAAGMFAISPMVNYLLASMGFLCLLVWATKNGMFQDIERPKDIMLEREMELDRRLNKPIPSASWR